MRLRYHLGKILFFVCHTLTFALNEPQSDTSGSSLKRTLTEYPSCRDSFEVHKDKIIRTQDSKALGAKYLNERDVTSRDECMLLCCSSDNCDVFVFEEKIQGSCYLFECGPPDDFKCKFTKHKNYTSAVLNVNRHLTDLESEIKFTQHEHELSKLREPFVKSAPTELPAVQKTTVSPKTKEVLQYAPESALTRRGCSRNQFECHGSGECIAIYNACDGIPQCADGSDESPDLGCPSVQSTTSTPIRHFHPSVVPPVQQQEFIPEAGTNGYSANSDREMNPPPVRKQWPVRDEYALKNSQAMSGAYPQKHLLASSGQSMNLQDPRVGYGREGEEMTNYRSDPSSWNSQYHHSQGSQIFTHKGEGLVPQTNRYQQQQHSFIAPEPQARSGMQYNDASQTDIAKYYMDNPQYNRLYNGQNSLPNSWQPGPKPHNLNVPELSAPQSLDEIPPNRGEAPQNGPFPDYYYEEMYKNKMQPFPVPPAYQQNEAPPAAVQVKVIPNNKEQAKPIEPKPKEAPVVHTSTTPRIEIKEIENKGSETSAARSHDSQVKSSHRKVDKLSVDVKYKESVVNSEEEKHMNGPRGAVLSLTMGLCITGVMLILVGCRMRMVSKRMRRGGKGYAHDADFLVNGMYL